VRELFGIALLLFAVFVAGALVFATDPVGSCMDAAGTFGPVGSCLRRYTLAAIGGPGAALIPLIAAIHALRLFGRMNASTDRSWVVFLGGAAVLAPVAIALTRIGLGLMTLSPAAADAWTGVWGSFAAYYLTKGFGTAGAWIVTALAVSGLMAATLAWNPIRMIVGQRRVAPSPTPASDMAAAESGDSLTLLGAPRAVLLEPSPEEMPALDPTLLDDSDPDVIPLLAGKRKRKGKDKDAKAPDRDSTVAAAIDGDTDDVALFASDELPTPDLLTPPPPRNVELGKRELDAMGVKLMDALRTFRVEGDLIGRTTGPVVTQFEIAPASGVKVRQFANLANDLALAMRAPSIRIVAPIPGRGAVGVEVPNPTAEMVAFRELLESREFTGARAALPIALGKDLEGRPVIADLAKMPHLLIAGATGSGKSVCVNTIITSLVYRHTPQTLRFLMVDPKMVELSVYNALPHLRHKVVTDNRDAAAVLKWAVMEMQERYELLAANRARNIQDFNRRLQENAPLVVPKRPNVAFEDQTYRGGILPYIVVVIDELADLMMTVQGEVEKPLAMLAQKARAIGIHLILATQRPSVNVITGLIKANFPSRIAFRVASQVDSRTIIDGMGAESLLGNGDMLFIPPGKSEPSRLQGAYISSEDTEALIGWYEAQRAARKAALEAHGLIVEETAPAEPDILEAVRQREAVEAGPIDGDGEGEGAGDRDKLFREAAEVIIAAQHGSTSLLQRRLKIGYGRAARIIDQLQAAGVLGPPDASKARDVLVGMEDLDRVCRRSD
jgi:S-DNA-T family DNA segregation ATPase FtsK/SpoIIIE